MKKRTNHNVARRRIRSQRKTQLKNALNTGMPITTSDSMKASSRNWGQGKIK